MKIIITGHTSGIGQALFNYFQSQGHTCIGFARSTGCDITQIDCRNRIVQTAIDADIFINNAYHSWDNSQAELLYSITALWQGENKLIINSATVATDIDDPRMANYVDTKILLDNFIKGRNSLPHIVNLKLGWVDTPRVADKNVRKISVDSVVEIVDFIVKNRDKYAVNSITVRPPM